MTSNLSWNGDPKKVVNQANKIVGFVKRNVGPGNRKSFLVCTRPWLYPFWNMLSLSGHPIYRRTFDALERVQRRASKYALPISSRDSPSKERLAMLGRSSLQSRRSYLSLLECCKTIHGLNGLTCNDCFEFNCYGKTKSNHSFKLRQPSARVNCFLHSFFVRII